MLTNSTCNMALEVGATVTLTGLTNVELNGNGAKVLRWDSATSRYELEIDGQTDTRLIKPENILGTTEQQKAEAKKGKEREVVQNLLKRFEPQGATIAMVEAALREAEGSTPAAVKIISKKLAQQETERKAREDDMSEAEAPAAAATQNAEEKATAAAKQAAEAEAAAAAAAVMQAEEARQKVGQEEISIDTCVDMC